MRSATYQNGLALDYLLAGEGGMCRKFNQTHCCLKIDDNGKAVTAIATNTGGKKLMCPFKVGRDGTLVTSLEAGSPLSVALRP